MFEIKIIASNAEELGNDLRDLLNTVGGVLSNSVTVPVATLAVAPEIAQTAPIQPQMQPPVQTVPTTAVTEKYTLPQIQLALGSMVDAGRREELQQLLSAFGVSAIMELPEESYPALVAALREKGVQV